MNRMRAQIIGATIAAVVASSSAFAAEQVALPVDVLDGLQNRWSVQKNGSAGGFKPFTHAALLQVDGISFPSEESATRRVLENGLEVVVGPKVVGPVRVTRKLFFGKGEGHIRYLDILENTSTTPVTVKVALSSRESGSNSSWTPVWENESCIVYEGQDDHVSAAQFVFGEGGRNEAVERQEIIADTVRLGCTFTSTTVEGSSATFRCRAAKA